MHKGHKNNCCWSVSSNVNSDLHTGTAHPVQAHNDALKSPTKLHSVWVKDKCPINTVSNEGFRKMVNTVDKRYVIISRNNFSKAAKRLLYAKHQRGNRASSQSRRVLCSEFYSHPSCRYSQCEKVRDFCFKEIYLGQVNKHLICLCRCYN